MSLKKRLSLFPLTTRIEAEQLTIAGCRLAELAAQYGTPLYVYDQVTMDTAVTTYQQALQTHYPAASGLTYAGKAALNLALAQWSQQHDLWLDCTGLGELAVAAVAGVPRNRTLLHGVNKTEVVLAQGVGQAGVIVVDNLTELARLQELYRQGKRPFPDLWLRFRPGQAVDTHAHVQTGQEDSKFGMSWEEMLAAADVCRQSGLPLTGLHFHLGSQFREAEPLAVAVARTLDLAQRLALPSDWTLCPGGGLGVAYHEADLPQPDVAEFIRFLAKRILTGCVARSLSLPRLQLEPGRSLVARAGVAVYQIGVVKETATRRWLLLDGGLADNLRHALYQARYTALPVQRPLRPAVGPVTLAGPYCESGDILIRDLPLPELTVGEWVAVPVSGAYQLSMASNYNGALRPAVLWLADGKAQLVQARETAVDLLRRDRPLAIPAPDDSGSGEEAFG